MSARDQFPRMDKFSQGSSGRDPILIAARREAARCLDELDRLTVAAGPVLEWFWQHGTHDPDAAELMRTLLDAYNRATGRAS